MATTSHSNLAEPNLHPNKIDATTGTELTAASESTYDNRWLRRVSATVGTSNAIYTSLKTAIDAVHTAGGGDVWIITPISLTGIVTLYKNVRVHAFGDLTPITISSSFPDGVALRDQSGDSTGLTLNDVTLDLSGKANVGGVHIYQGDFVRLRNLHITGQGFTSSSKWTLRVGNYTSGSPAGTASHGTIIENLRIDNCNSGTFEQVLFVNQQDARIINPYFESNTNSSAYELMLYVNNKNVVVENPHFETPSANSIGMMESDGVLINNTTANYGASASSNVFTIINTRNVLIKGVQATSANTSRLGSIVNFFDRTVGPDGFTQIVDDTEKVLIQAVKADGFKSIATAQTIGTVLGTAYTGNQTNVRFENIEMRNGTIPFNIGIDDAANNLTNWDFHKVNVLSWNGTLAGAFQLRGYSSGVSQMSGFRLDTCKVVPSTGGLSNGAVRALGSTVQYIRNCDFTGTFATYTAISTPNNGVVSQVINTIGLNPDLLYAQGNVTGATTFDRANGQTITATLTGNITVTLPAGQLGDHLTLILTQDATGSRTVTWPSNFKKSGGSLTLTTTANSVDVIDLVQSTTNWREVSRSLNEI